MGGQDLMVRNAVNSWKQVVGQVDKTIGGFGDEELQREVAPGQEPAVLPAGTFDGGA